MSDHTFPAPDEHIWCTAIGRAEFAFQSLLHTKAGAFFLNHDHLQAIVDQRRRTSFTGALFFFAAIAISFVIILKSADLTVDIQTPAGTIENVPISNNVLLFALSVVTSYYARSLINHFLLNKQVQAIFEHTGLDTAEAISRAAHTAARWSADQLWIDVLTFRPFGFRSGATHIALVLISLFVMVGLALTQISIILIAAYAGLAEASAGDALSYWLVALPSFVAVHFAIFGTFIALLVPMKFKWKPATTSEPLPPSGPAHVGPEPLPEKRG